MSRTPWPAEALWEQLLPLLPGLSVEVAASCPSTNTTLLDRARAGDTAPALLVAERQTQGRGRLGRPWQSAEGASLTFSLALPYEPVDWNGLSLGVGVALAGALDPAGERLALKWPNDLWLRDHRAPAGGRKLGGVLTETVAVGDRRVAVIGCGLNVMALPDDVDAAALASGYACLREFDPAASAPSALSRIALPLAQALRDFETLGFAAFAPRFAARDLLRGRAVSTTSAEASGGIVEGVAHDGALLLRRGDGTVQRLTSGEVSVRPVAAGEVRTC